MGKIATKKQAKKILGERVVAGKITQAQAQEALDTHLRAAKAAKDDRKVQKRYEKAKQGKEAALKAAKLNPTEKNMQKAAMPLAAFAPKTKAPKAAAPVYKGFNDKMSAVLSDENVARFSTDPVMREAAQARVARSEKANAAHVDDMITKSTVELPLKWYVSSFSDPTKDEWNQIRARHGEYLNGSTRY